MRYFYLAIAAVLTHCCCLAQSSITEFGANVGISTPAPVAKLDVNGAVRVGSGSNVDPGTGSALWLGPANDYATTLAGYSIGFNTGNSNARTSRLYTGTNGNTGIGTRTPASLLSLGSSQQHTKLAIFDNNTYQWGFGTSAKQFEQYFTSDDPLDHISWGSMSTDGTHTFRELARLDGSGNVSIGATDPQGHRLAVNGSMIANAITIKVYPWADDVFNKNYHFPGLTGLKSYIDRNGHLPGIPSATEVAADGVNQGDMNRLLMKKLEELTLYVLRQDSLLKAQHSLLGKQVASLKSQNAALDGQQSINESIQSQLDKIKNKAGDNKKRKAIPSTF